MAKPPKRWSLNEDRTLRSEVEHQLVVHDGEVRSWKEVAGKIPGRNNKDCRKRYYNEVMGGLKKGPWTKIEDGRLKDLIASLGPAWAAVSKQMNNRTADQCSKRWNHFLDPNLDHSAWTYEENVMLSIAAKTHGSLWKDIQAIHFSERSSNNIKNQYTALSRRAFQVPSNSPPCCDEGNKRGAAAHDDYEQGRIIEGPFETSDLVQLDTGEEIDHAPDFDQILGLGSAFDHTGYDPFSAAFPKHSNAFVAEDHPFQSPPTNQINGLHYQASNGHFAELQSSHGFSHGNTVGSSQPSHVGRIAGSRRPGEAPSIAQQRPSAARRTLTESPATDHMSTPKSSSSGQATECLSDDTSGLDEVRAESAMGSNQTCSRQKRRITITLEHADPKTLASFLNSALQSEAKISFETDDFGT
ncbi:MAG: hypothetical protein Q9209_006526 [Squamulea sp. 1 TL-2023]